MSGLCSLSLGFELVLAFLGSPLAMISWRSFSWATSEALLL